MIGYNCKYTPVELLQVFDDCFLINNDAEQFEYSQSVMHINMCSHAKATLEEIHKNNIENLFFVNCCDSTRRVFDVVSSNDNSYKRMLDLPIETSTCAVKKLRNDLLELIEELEVVYKKPFDKKKFIANFSNEASKLPNGKFLALMGARSNEKLLSSIKASFDLPVIDMTCVNNRNVMGFLMNEENSIEDLMGKYATALLKQMPCMRMSDTQLRKSLFNNDNCVGIIYHTIKFCDYYGFEYCELEKLGMPIIKIETDFTTQSAGQIFTRLEGFAEAMNEKQQTNSVPINTNGKYYAGIDSGSTTTELVILDENRNIINSVMVRTGANAGIGAEKALSQSGIALSDIKNIVATGYGRKNISFAMDSVTEITCHAKGAKFLYDDVDVIIDIGGQDSKVITLSKSGDVTNFVMNDKCAAGTGRFLENMAKVLEIDMDTMATIGLEYKKDLTISNMCTVFAESEVVSLIAENYSTADIVHGLNNSVASKTRALAHNADTANAIMMTGGVANNKGVVLELEKLLGKKIFIPKNPEFCGALGAALFAIEKAAQ